MCCGGRGFGKGICSSARWNSSAHRNRNAIKISVMICVGGVNPVRAVEHCKWKIKIKVLFIQTAAATEFHQYRSDERCSMESIVHFDYMRSKLIEKCICGTL